MIFITFSPSGGDYRWCLHVCKRPPSPEREETLRGDRQHGAGLVEWSHQLQDPPSSGVQAATSDWSTHGRVCRRCGRHGHAQVLLVRWHRQHGFQNGVYRERYIGHFLIDAFIVTISEEIRLSSIFCLMIKMYLMWRFLPVALHIHISTGMNSALKDLGWGFMTMERGIIDVKVS